MSVNVANIELEIMAVMSLHQRGFEFPAAVLDATRKCIEAINSGGDATDADFKLSLSGLEKWISTKNKPGEGNLESSAPADWKPCGKAEGVIYLGALENDLNIEITSGEMDGRRKDQQRGHKKYFFNSLNRQAFRYLKPAEVLERVKRRNPHGLVKVRFDKIAAHIPSVSAIAGEIEEVASFEGRPIHAWFTLSDAGIMGVQPAHATRWIARKVEAGIWALFYA